jgi:serine phosphatase RsbU (regulator of sigma subunit)
MKIPVKHIRETERLDALRNSGLLDTAPEQEYDDITLLASFITKSPVSMISLIDANRQWFKSKIGIDLTETPRDEAFCAHAIHESEIFEVEDATKDDRFNDNPLVLKQKLKFYAGTPLLTEEGLPLGMLCVMDNEPKKLSEEQRKALNALGRQVLAQIKLREKNEEVTKELNIAKNIQKSMLPAKFVPNESNKEIRIAAVMSCAKEVGGDLYDYFYNDEKHLAIALGDVSGKGVPAALYMAMSKILIRATAGTTVNPADCIYKVNNVLVNENVTTMFITLCYGVLNVETGELEIVNAGHNPPIIMKSNGSINYCREESQLLLGIVENYPYVSRKIIMEKGDSILFYTDGVTEAFNKDDEEYGEERLLNFCKSNYTKGEKEFSDSLVYDIYRFSEGVTQSDDITMMVLKYN